MRRLLQGGFVLPVLLLGGCGGLNFKEFTPPEGGFTVLMPGTPEKKTIPILDMTMIGYGVNVKNGAYAVGFMDMPAGRPFSLDGALQGIVNQHKGKVLSQSKFTMEGSSGTEFEIESSDPKGYVSGRMIVVRGRFYEILAMGTKARLSNTDVRKYLDSFKLTK
jgi:hypothetical protein